MSNWPSTKARKVYKALVKIGWKPKPGKGSSHIQLTHPEMPEYTWAFHDSEEIRTGHAEAYRQTYRAQA